MLARLLIDSSQVATTWGSAPLLRKSPGKLLVQLLAGHLQPAHEEGITAGQRCR
jgi:hypothetical protein